MRTGLSLISIGISDEQDVSLRAIEEAKKCDVLYFEAYTTKLNTDSIRLGEVFGKTVNQLRRGDLEEKSGSLIEEARTRKIGILVGGDCLAATTHLALIIEAKKNGIQTKIVHGSSIFTALTETGLSLYKFGRTVTMPLPEKGPADTVLKAIEENMEHGLHTLVLLDINAESNMYLTINRALEMLMEQDGPVSLSEDTLVVGIARLGAENGFIAAGRAVEISKTDFGEPPHALIIPAKLHFVEAEALNILHGCPRKLLDRNEARSQIEKLISKYASSCRRALEELKFRDLPRSVGYAEVKDLIGHAERYLSDALYYSADRKATSLASLSYCEGILDALRLLGMVDFEW